MSKSFDLGAYLRGQSAAVSDSDTERIVRIGLDLIDPDPSNFYSLGGIEELAANIETVGLLDPLRVRPAGERYTVVSGHRRRAACMMIRDGGSDMFDKGVPCIVDLGEASEAMRELRLIYANSATRVMGPAEIARQAERVTELLYRLKEEGVEFPGRMRDHVAQACQVSAAKIARLHAIRQNLCEGYQDLFDAGRLSESGAYRISQEPPEVQRKLFDKLGSAACGIPAERLDAAIEQAKRPADASRPAPLSDPCDPFKRLNDYLIEKKSEDFAFFEKLELIADRFLRDLSEQTTRQNAIAALGRYFRHAGSCGGLVDWEGSPKGLIIGQLSDHPITRSWTEVYDMLSLIAIDRAADRIHFPDPVSDSDTNEDPAAEVYMGRPHWQTGEVPWEGRYLCRIDMQDGGTHEATGEYRGGSWSVFGGPLYEGMRIREWWPLPEKGGLGE